MPEHVLISGSVFVQFSTSKMVFQIDKNHDKPTFGTILSQDGSKEALWIGLVGAKASLFIDFAAKYVAFMKFPICRYVVLGTSFSS